MNAETRIANACAIAVLAPSLMMAGCSWPGESHAERDGSQIMRTVGMPVHESTGSGDADSLFSSYAASWADDAPDDNGMSHGDEQTDGAEDASDESRQSEGGQIPEEPSPEPDRAQGIPASDGEEIGPQATDGRVDGGIREPFEMREVTEMISDSFLHGPLPADKVRYIVMHDTESGTDSAETIAASWSGGHIAAHFIVDKQGRVVNCSRIS